MATGAARRGARPRSSNQVGARPAPVAEVEEEAKRNDISVRGALKRAKTALGIKTWKEKGKVDGDWFWELPAAATARQHHDA